MFRRGQGQVPGEATIAYYDVARDYQTGLQRAVRTGGRSRRPPGVAGGARRRRRQGAGRSRLASLWAGRVTGKAVAGWRLAASGRAAMSRSRARQGLWLVARRVLGPMTADASS